MEEIQEALSIARTRSITWMGIPYTYGIFCAGVAFLAFMLPTRATGSPIIGVAIGAGATFIMWAIGYELTRRRASNMAIFTHYFLTRRHQGKAFGGRVYDPR